MKILLNFSMGMLLALLLTGCFGEDYDVGVPTALLNFDTNSVRLAEANISWNTASEDVQETIENIEEYAASLEEIKVFTEQKASLSFTENEENGGDIWTDPKITAALLQKDQIIQLELNDSGEIRFPANIGQYILEVEFSNSAGTAQYVGNVVIGANMEIEDGKLPEFFSIEMPTIKKVTSSDFDGFVFDHSYEEVCWKTCHDQNNYQYPDIHSGNVEIGDTILVNWLTMKPQPTEINFITINAENEEIDKTRIDVSNTPYEIEITEEMIPSQYAFEFLWKDANEIKGKSMLNFRIE